MKTRQLGTNGLKISEIGFGCMGLNSTYSHSLANEESIALIRLAVDPGVTFFDTAEIYGPLPRLRDVRFIATLGLDLSNLLPDEIRHKACTWREMPS